MNPSLLLIPDRYKASKLYSQIPDSGAGDLAFTRANDTATRVNSEGLIEKVRTNLFLQSNTFTNAAWGKIGGVTITGGQSDPEGGSNAFLYSRTLAFDYIVQPLASNSYTISIYAKANASNFLRIASAAVGDAVFDLSTGTITSSSSSTPVITSVGNGWYRCSVYFPTASTQHFIQNFPVNNGADGAGSIYIYEAQAELGDIATPYIPTTTAAVSVGPVANIPRIDYTGGGCGKLLLEPQRTNLTQYSEQLNNGYWNKTGSTATANAIVSPDGFQNADLLTESATTADHAFFDVVSYFVSGTTYTLSFFAKANGRTKIEVVSANSGTCPTGRFDLVAQTATPLNDSFGAKIENYGNGWFRCSVSRVAPNTGLDVPYHTMVQSFGTITYAGDGTSGMYFWGMQTEVGSYVSSYIPTLGASVTRSADSASKTGISSLIGQSEGTIYWEFTFDTAVAVGYESILNTDNGSFGNTIYIFKGATGSIVAEMYVGGVLQASFTLSSQPAGTYKAAFAYANNNTAFFINGVQVGSTDTSCIVGTMSRVQIGNGALGASTDKTSAVALYTTRLSNADLQSLTTL